jgi:murein hydrolase activator
MGGVVRRVRRTVKKAVGEVAKATGLAPTNKQIAEQAEAARRAQEQAAAQAAAQAKAQAEADAAAKAAAAEKQRKAEEAMKAQQAVQVVDAPGDPNNPADVVYSGEGDDMTGGKKKRRKKGSTIMTGSKGVIGDAPTEKATLLGG